MRVPLRVFSQVPQGATASFAYRLTTPLTAMRDLGLPLLAMIDTDSTKISAMDRVEAFCNSDVALLYQPIGTGPLNNIRQVQSFIPCKVDGKWKWPPTLIVDSDDNLFHVSVLNPAYHTLGTKAPDGTEIPSGNSIGIMENGRKAIKWIDGHTCDGKCGPNGEGDCHKGINLAANREGLNLYRTIINLADSFTCSTPPIAERVMKEASPKRVKVFPNMVRFDDYEQVDLAPHPQEIRILWQGGQNHYEDWFPLKKQLGRITKQYPMVQWVICGAKYDWVLDEIPAERFTFKNWWPYHEHKLRMAMMGHDINLAPLSDTPFNSCRSAIKWYESSVLKRPAVTLAQNTSAYKAEMQDGETGLLFNTPEEFEEKLSYLIEQETERKRMAQNAKDWINENRDIMKRAPEIYSYWTQLREERKTEQPHVTDEAWVKIEAQADEEERQAQEAAQQNGAVA